MVSQTEIKLSSRPKGFHLITEEILKSLPALPSEGLLHLFILHTSAGLAVNENADPTVRSDLDKAFDILAPENQPFYEHTMEGPDDMPAHVKAILSGSSVSIPVSKGKLNLGTWQGIYLCEFRKDAPVRKLIATILA